MTDPHDELAALARNDQAWAEARAAIEDGGYEVILALTATQARAMIQAIQTCQSVAILIAGIGDEDGATLLNVCARLESVMRQNKDRK